MVSTIYCKINDKCFYGIVNMYNSNIVDSILIFFAEIFVILEGRTAKISSWEHRTEKTDFTEL